MGIRWARYEGRFADAAAARRRCAGSRWGGCALALAMLGGVALPGQQRPSPNPEKPLLLPEANRLPDANQQMEMRDRQNKAKDYSAANAERKKQIAGDSARMLKLANELKSEVNKTNKDTLSPNAMRKADEIERLAHNVQEKMKLMVGPG